MPPSNQLCGHLSAIDGDSIVVVVDFDVARDREKTTDEEEQVQERGEKMCLLTSKGDKYGATFADTAAKMVAMSEKTARESEAPSETEREPEQTPSSSSPTPAPLGSAVDEDDNDEDDNDTKEKRLGRNNSCESQSFLLKILSSIALAYIYPPLGSYYVVPRITTSWVAVMTMFLIAGLGLKTDELRDACRRVWYNSFVQLFNYLGVSSFVYALTRVLVRLGWLHEVLADGMVICSCLPVSVSIIIVLSTSADGDSASAVFAAAIGNLTGVVVSPLLIFAYLGVKGGGGGGITAGAVGGNDDATESGGTTSTETSTAAVSAAEIFTKLAVRVLLPLFLGQVLQKCYEPIRIYVSRNKAKLKAAQEWCLAYIVYCVFCKTFETGVDASLGDVLTMISLQGFMLCCIMSLAWACLSALFRNEPKLRVTGLFGCTLKTLALGVPLIGAMYENDPNAGLYTLPLIVWHPMQLVLGSGLSPYLATFVDREERRLGRRM